MQETRGRAYNTSRPLGQLMSRRGLNCRDVERLTDIYSRTLTELLAGRKLPNVDQLRALCYGLECTVEDILLPGEMPLPSPSR